RGGQAGHKRHLREPLPPEQVDEQITIELDDAEVLRLGLTPTDDYEVVQHIEFLEHPLHVIEYRFRKYVTSTGETVLPDAPELTGAPIFGPRLLAMIGWLKSAAHCSYSTIETYLEDVLAVPVSRGYLAKLCNGIVSESLAEPYEELKQALPRQSHLGSDETGIKNNGRKHWIWCVAAPLFSLFHIAASRSRSVLEELIGEGYRGYLTCDYFSANCSFAWNFDIRVQYCWAHLIRDIRFLTKHPDAQTKKWAEELLDVSRRLFQAWHRRDKMTQAGRQRSLANCRNQLLEIVRTPPRTKEAQNIAARFAVVEIDEGGIYDLSWDYFRFLYGGGLQPTNNHSEQQIRHCVIDRKITQGTRSEAGQRYHERMWTAIATCRKQNRRFYEYLRSAITAQLQEQPAPSLLPNPAGA
ncbi:MAG TPA: IS66 family transposase, partial [Pseudorhizobium sp.]|nr:IS66 family transposase [Pseudorhizobium sp.]